jgi:AbrB family looped-hinge helix DNA binding protein
LNGTLTTLTGRGRVSIPAYLRKQLHLKPGQLLMWEKVSDDECHVRIMRHHKGRGVASMRGFINRFQKDSSLPHTTSGWMKLLRER